MTTTAFMPQQPTGFPGGFNPAYAQSHASYYGSSGPSTPQQSSHQQSIPHAQAQSQAFPQTGFQNHGGGGNAAMASTGGHMMPQAQFTGQQQQYHTSAPFSQSVPAQAPSAASLPAQQHLANLRQHQSASPQQLQSPNAASQPRHQSPQNKYPMAAPPLPQTPAAFQQQAAATSNGAPSPQTPQTPGTQIREQQRASVLLDINVELLQEVSRLQAEGKGGATSPQQAAQLKAQGQPCESASQEYVDVLRRVNANIAYLMPKASNDKQKMVKGPAHMTPPPHMPQLQSMYDQLKLLFPDWLGYDQRGPAQSSASPRSNGMTASPSTSVQTPA